MDIQSSKSIHKKRNKWSDEENDILKSLVLNHSQSTFNWEEIAQQLQGLGFMRTSKACQDRYDHYINEKINRQNLNGSEINQLIDLVKLYGNQWSLIATELKNRSEQKIKNSFYAFVKKIFRRLVKNVQNYSSSSRVSKIKPIIYSNLFCPNHIKTRDYVYIDDEIKEKFQNLIFLNQNIKKSQKLDEITKINVAYTLSYLEIKNQILSKKSDYQENTKKYDYSLTKSILKNIREKKQNIFQIYKKQNNKLIIMLPSIQQSQFQIDKVFNFQFTNNDENSPLNFTEKEGPFISSNQGNTESNQPLSYILSLDLH